MAGRAASLPVAQTGRSADRRAQATGAIARAAQATGVDFQYLMAQARLESGFDPSARAATSSATGLYQFTEGTWLETLDRHGAAHGLDWAQGAIDGGRVADPTMRARILALRGDPEASALMAAELAGDNAIDLTATLGRTPDPTELYLAHFLGSAGAGQFLSALATDPGQSAAAVLPKAAAANRAIFFGSQGPRSVADVMALMRARVSGAMDEGADAASWQAAGGNGLPDVAAMPGLAQGPLAREFGQWRAAMPGTSAIAPPTAPTPSMAETLRGTFGSGADTPGTAQVRAAYARLARFGL
ncbi:transglycosylase SLT domain-containing protein [Novosphingobium colocasiae]|uniref:transglycosylase SLT domain-containing protein n=1 Tax=Novosphingobium colocasiae TaxID=1256513 RepID=UPI0035AF0C0D